MKRTLFLGLAVVVAAACSERLPRQDATAAPPGSVPAWGLETRPAAACAFTVAGAPEAKISFQRISPIDFDVPVDLAKLGSRIYVVEQKGTVKLLSADFATASTVIDIGPTIVSGGESGLLGMTFHPQFATNHYVYLSFTAPFVPGPPPAGTVFQSVIARYVSNDGGLTIDPASEKRLLTLEQPFSNHNGGKILFGNDGLLYVSFGDGGSGGDPFGNGQNKNVLFGKILRLDVDGGDPYAIPPANPFAGGGGRPEIYAYGLRNPWRFTFDRPTGDLWVGDVGQGEREEVDKVVLGGNYGWNIREGKTCYAAATCATSGLIDPIVDYTHAEGSAITGGVLYRGTGVPSLTGKYVYADEGSGNFWSISPTDPAPIPDRLEQGLFRVNPTVIELTPDGEIMFAAYTGGIWRVATPVPGASPVSSLAETGCVDATDPMKPAAGLLPYDVNVGEWLDGAATERFLAIPADTKLGVNGDGSLVLPLGGTAIRNISRNGKRTETQMLTRGGDGVWAAYDFVWASDGSAAAPIASSQCMLCHTEAAGVTLGLEAGQLDRDFDYGASHGNQLATLDHVGLLASPVPPGIAALPAIDGYAATELRARAYLHANCSGCHRSSELVGMDLRFSTSFPNSRTCDAVDASTSPFFAGKKRIAPGDPDASAIVLAMKAMSDGRMPPLDSQVVDARAVSVISDWIRALGPCVK